MTAAPDLPFRESPISNTNIDKYPGDLAAKKIGILARLQERRIALYTLTKFAPSGLTTSDAWRLSSAPSSPSMACRPK